MGIQSMKGNVPRNQYESWLKTMPADYCAFCDIKGEQKVIEENEGWVWVVNRRGAYLPYQTLIIPRRHIVELSECTPEELTLMQELIQEATQDYKKLMEEKKVPGKIMIFWRFRDESTRKNKSTDHLHLNLMPYKGEIFDHILDPDAHLTNF